MRSIPQSGFHRVNLTISAKRKIFLKMKVFDIYKLELENMDCCFLIKDGIFWRVMNLNG